MVDQTELTSEAQLLVKRLAIEMLDYTRELEKVKKLTPGEQLFVKMFAAELFYQRIKAALGHTVKLAEGNEDIFDKMVEDIQKAIKKVVEADVVAVSKKFNSLTKEQLNELAQREMKEFDKGGLR